MEVDGDGSNATRILTPATHWLADGGSRSSHPRACKTGSLFDCLALPDFAASRRSAWPFFYERAGATEMMSATSRNSSVGDWTYPNFPEASIRPTDHSYAYLWWEKRDVWFDLISSPRKVRCGSRRLSLPSQRCVVRAALGSLRARTVSSTKVQRLG